MSLSRTHSKNKSLISVSVSSGLHRSHLWRFLGAGNVLVPQRGPTTTLGGKSWKSTFLFSCLKTWLWLLGSQWALCFCVQEQGCQLWRAVFVWALGGRSSAGAELQPAGPGAAGLLSSHCCTHCSPSQHRPLSCRHLQLLTALWAVQGIGNHCSIPPDWCGNLKAIWNQYHHQLHPRLQR